MMSPAARAQAAAAAVFLGAVALVAAYAPPWTIAIAGACAIWRLLVASGRLPTPRQRRGTRFLFGAITAVLVGAVLLSFRTLNGLGAGTALLVLMGALKLLESRNRRDDGIVIGVALFLLLAAALAGQTLIRLPLYLGLLWVACSAMMVVAHPSSGLPLRATMRLAARTLAMAAPLAVACFLFFPRFGGQLWVMSGPGGAVTGLSDEMSPGAIEQLINEYEPAFRVRFEGTPPPPEDRYWRGPVLNSFDGFTWRRERILYRDTPVTPVGEAVRYRVTLEPTNRSWVFALDTVDGSPQRGVLLSHDRVLWRTEPIIDTFTYDASSHLDTVAMGPLSAAGRRFETRLPSGPNPRAVALARELRAQSSDDADFSRRVLAWFDGNRMEYTLQPEPTSLDSVDSVLFDTRQGFCGHFASAYATMMRAAGVPARVVTGYLGGEWNPVGGYFIVRQSDAHAWTEVWLEDSGWTRVDPTAVVEPGRLQRGVYDVLSASSTPVGISVLRSRWMSAMARYWDGANQWWRERVLDFDVRAQLDFLREFGIETPDWSHLGWAFVAALLLWLLWVATTLRRSLSRAKPDRIARAWLRATRKLERVAAPRAPSEGALTYARRIAEAHPSLAQPVLSIATRYTRLRFGPEAPPDEVATLEREVRRLAA